MREKVRSARSIQLTRFSGESITANAEMSNTLIEKYCVLSSETDQFLKQAVQRLDLSTRVYFRLLRLARTIADIDGSETIEKAHLAEALSYRERRG